MAVSFTNDGTRIRVEWLRPLLRQIASIIFLAPALYLAYYLALGIRQDLSDDGDLRSNIPGLLALLAITLVVAIPATSWRRSATSSTSTRRAVR